MNANPPHFAQRARAAGLPRSGFTLTELCMATAMLAVVAAGVFKATVALDHARRSCLRQDTASRELDNLLERFVHQPWETLTQQTADQLQPPEAITNLLPAATLETIVADETEPLDAKRITMRLRWRNQAGRETTPLALTAWVYREAPSGQSEEPQP